MVRPEGVPDSAEAFSSLPFVVQRRVPSKLIPDRTPIVEQIIPELACPNCGTRGPTHYLETVVCAGCNLSLHLSCSYLFAWRAEVKPALSREQVRNTLRSVSQSELLR